jgi:hypothetical protein
LNKQILSRGWRQNKRRAKSVARGANDRYEGCSISIFEILGADGSRQKENAYVLSFAPDALFMQRPTWILR